MSFGDDPRELIEIGSQEEKSGWRLTLALSTEAERSIDHLYQIYPDVGYMLPHFLGAFAMSFDLGIIDELDNPQSAILNKLLSDLSRASNILRSQLRRMSETSLCEPTMAFTLANRGEFVFFSAMRDGPKVRFKPSYGAYLAYSEMAPERSLEVLSTLARDFGAYLFAFDHLIARSGSAHQIWTREFARQFMMNIDVLRIALIESNPYR